MCNRFGEKMTKTICVDSGSRYVVNLFVDNGRTEGAPVIVELTPPTIV